jgi:hypothetical protein
MRSITVSLLILTLVACGGDGGNGGGSSSGAPPPADYIDYPPLWNDYKLGFGETINLAESVAIEFQAVEEDTRCPTGAQCITDGNARVRVKAITPRGAQLIELNTSPALPTSALFDYYGITLRKLEPYPTLDPQTGTSKIPDSDYEGTFFVIKAAQPP